MLCYQKTTALIGFDVLSIEVPQSVAGNGLAFRLNFKDAWEPYPGAWWNSCLFNAFRLPVSAEGPAKR